MKPKLIKTDGSVLSGVEERPQKGFDPVFRPTVTTDVLVKMDHVEWLQNFAKVMQLQTGIEMTPMRAGVISRCNLAAEYILYMKAQNRALEQKISDAVATISRAKSRKTDAKKLAAAAGKDDGGEQQPPQ